MHKVTYFLIFILSFTELIAQKAEIQQLVDEVSISEIQAYVDSLCWAGGYQSRITYTEGTTETYIGEVFIPCNMTVTGVAVFNGSNVTGNMNVGLANSSGANVAESTDRMPWYSGATILGRVNLHIALKGM